LRGVRRLIPLLGMKFLWKEFESVKSEKTCRSHSATGPYGALGIDKAVSSVESTEAGRDMIVESGQAPQENSMEYS
jgi:hypothetical protein